MTETKPEAPAQATPEAPKPSEQSPAGQSKADETDWKAEARKWESRAKENGEKAKQFDAVAEAQKTEQQKLEERATTAEKNAAAAQTEAARLRVALTKGLTTSQAKRLVGETEDALARDADEMLADLQPGKPKGDIGQGHRPGQSTGSPEQDFAHFLGAQMGTGG